MNTLYQLRKRPSLAARFLRQVSFASVMACGTAAWAWPAPPTYTFKSLGTLGGASSTAEGINDSGDVVGISETADGSSAPYLYTASGGMRNLNVITEGPVENPARTLFGPDGKFYVINGGTGLAPETKGSVAVFDPATGDFLRYLVEPGIGGLQSPGNATFGPDDGDLYVPTFSGPNSERSRIARFDGETGAYLGDFVPHGFGGVRGIPDLVFGPDRDGDGHSDLYVSSAITNEVLLYSGQDGKPLGAFVSAASGGLQSPGRLLFHDLGGDGTKELLVCSRLTGQVLAYDGSTGEFLRPFTNLSADMQIGPDGNLYATANPGIDGGDDGEQVWQCDGQTGEVLGLFIPPDAGGWSCAAPRLTFDAQGTIYVNSGDTNQILRFEGPLSANPGQFKDTFIDGVGFELISAYDINNAGQIVGHGYPLAHRALYAHRATYRYTPPAPGKLVGRVDDLGVPGVGNNEFATAINDDGDVAGHFQSETTNQWHAFLWTPETGVVDLGRVNGGNTYVTAISNRSGGQIQVTGYAGSSGKERAWRYNTASGIKQDLGLVGGKSGYSHGWDINTLGVVTGTSTNGAKLRAFTFNTMMLDLGTLGGNNAQAWGINDFGDVVGTSDTSTKSSTNRHQAFVRMSGVGMFKLEPQITNLPGSMNLKVAPWRINNGGQIIGPGRFGPAGTAYVITPQ